MRARFDQDRNTSFRVRCCLLQELRRGGMGGTGAVEPTYTVQLQAETHALRVRAQTHRGPVTVEFVTCATCASRCRHPAAVAKATLRSTLSSDGLTLTYNTLVRASI